MDASRSDKARTATRAGRIRGTSSTGRGGFTATALAGQGESFPAAPARRFLHAGDTAIQWLHREAAGLANRLARPPPRGVDSPPARAGASRQESSPWPNTLGHAPL